MRTIEQLLAAFTLKSIQNALTLYDWLNQNNRTFEDVREYIRKGPKNVTKQARSLPRKECPSCGKRMFPYPVNTLNCNQVGGDYNYQWLCRSCHYEEFVEEI